MLSQKIRVRLVALLLLFLNNRNYGGAFVAPAALRARSASQATKFGLNARSNAGYSAPKMVLTGLPSNKNRKRPWEEDFPTTLGKAAFSSLKEKARDMMVKGAEKRGLDWTGIVEALKVSLYRIGSRRAASSWL